MNEQQPVIIAVDFDGTIVEHAYPEVGDPVPGALDWLAEFQASGAKLILWTMRSHPHLGAAEGERDCLAEATKYLSLRGIELWGVNCNPDQAAWTSSPKVYANIYIDDAAAGCPLRESDRAGARPFVDWSVLGPAVMEQLDAVNAGWATDAALIAAKARKET